MQISKYRVQYQNAGENYWETLTSDKKEDYEYKRGSDTVIDKNAWKIIIPTINEEFFNNSTPIVGEDGDEELLNIKIRIVATKIDSDEKNHTIVKRKETVIKKLELSNAEVVMPINATRTITATPTTEEEIVYYAKTNGNYYKIEKNAEGKYIVQEDKTEIRDEELTLSTSAISNVNISIDQATKVITLNGIAEVESELTVTYGVVRPQIAKCKVRVLSELDYIDEKLEEESEIPEKIDDYVISKHTEHTVTDLDLTYPSSMGTNESSIIVTKVYTNVTDVYYVVVGGQNYKIEKINGVLQLDRNPYIINNETQTLEAIANNSYVSVGTPNQSTLEIPITSGSSTGTSTITVSYGGKTKECKIGVYKIIKPSNTSGTDSTISFKKTYGEIEIIWLEGTTNTVTEIPNHPIISHNGEAMTPVYWDGNNQIVETTESDTNWYSYIAITGTDKNIYSRWANAKTKNGSFFVWIPRYAYRIIYYSETDTNATGYYDGWGMWQNGGKIKYALDDGIETVDYQGKKYIVHPAFMDDRNKTDKNGNKLEDFNRGGWDKNISGIWVAKFEVGKDSSGNIDITYGTKARGDLTIGEMYTAARSAKYGFNGSSSDGYTCFMNSHMTKNSEWGAVSYLTYSRYGTNMTEIVSNDNSKYYRGGNSGEAYLIHVDQSTTGNAYGIYDLHGLYKERIACYDRLVTATNISNGSSFATKNGTSTKYATAYTNGTSTYYGEEITYKVGKVGDATKEIYAGTYANDRTGLLGDWIYVPYKTEPFIERGSDSFGSSSGGLFCIDRETGYASSIEGYRTVLCP